MDEKTVSGYTMYNWLRSCKRRFLVAKGQSTFFGKARAEWAGPVMQERQVKTLCCFSPSGFSICLCVHMHESLFGWVQSILSFCFEQFKMERTQDVNFWQCRLEQTSANAEKGTEGLLVVLNLEPFV